MDEERELMIAFGAVCLVLGAVLVLFYYKGQPNSKGKRAVAFVFLLVGEALLFPWGSTVDWLKVAVIATVNYVLGADKVTLDGVVEALRNFFHQSPPSGGAPGSTCPEVVSTTANMDMLSEEIVSQGEANWARSELSLIRVVLRMLWPDMPGRR
jgi:hypothetical protein